jgi:hypothetical protein
MHPGCADGCVEAAAMFPQCSRYAGGTMPTDSSLIGVVHLFLVISWATESGGTLTAEDIQPRLEIGT